MDSELIDRICEGTIDSMIQVIDLRKAIETNDWKERTIERNDRFEVL